MCLIGWGAAPVLTFQAIVDEFGAFMRAETVRWGKVVKAARMSVD